MPFKYINGFAQHFIWYSNKSKFKSTWGGLFKPWITVDQHQNGLFSWQNVVSVIIGGTLGHALCTGLAVIGGRLIAQRISVRTGTYS